MLARVYKELQKNRKRSSYGGGEDKVSDNLGKVGKNMKG